MSTTPDEDKGKVKWEYLDLFDTPIPPTPPPNKAAEEWWLCLRKVARALVAPQPTAPRRHSPEHRKWRGKVYDALRECSAAAAAVGTRRERQNVLPALSKVDEVVRGVVAHTFRSPTAVQPATPARELLTRPPPPAALAGLLQSEEVMRDLERAARLPPADRSIPTGYSDAQALAEELKTRGIPVTAKCVYLVLTRHARAIETQFGSKSWRVQNKNAGKSPGRRAELGRSEPAWVFSRAAVLPHLLDHYACNQ